jgi:uncharacterized protein (TIRG00374 family)
VGSNLPVFKQWRFWIGLLTSAVFLILAFRGQDFAQIGRALSNADYRFLVPAVAVYFAGVYMRAVRWQALLRPIKPLSAAGLFPFVVIGYMANNLLPARTGEFVRAYALSQREGIKKSASLATIAIERIFDGLTMILFILVASLLIRLNQQVELLTIIATILFVGLLAGLAAFAALPRLQALLLGLLHRLLPARLSDRLEAILVAFVAGLGSLRSRRGLLRIVLTSIAAWGCEAGMYLVVAAAFGLNLGWPVALLATAVANLFTLLPSSPGYVGIFEAGVLAVLVGLLGMPEAPALSYAIVLHAALWLPVTALGLVSWSRESLSWGDLRQLDRTSDGGSLGGPGLRPTGRG